MTLLELAAKIEAAEGPDFELMSDAFDLCFPKPKAVWADDYKTWTPEYTEWFGRQVDFCAYLEVGAWENAAMMLKPDGYSWRVEDWKGEATAKIQVRESVFTALAATPALALTAAALRARSENPA